MNSITTKDATSLCFKDRGTDHTATHQIVVFAGHLVDFLETSFEVGRLAEWIRQLDPRHRRVLSRFRRDYGKTRRHPRVSARFAIGLVKWPPIRQVPQSPDPG